MFNRCADHGSTAHFINGCDEPMAPWERELLGVIDLGIVQHDGNGLSFPGVSSDSLRYHETDGVSWLVFNVANRTYRVPNVQYWTEQ